MPGTGMRGRGVFARGARDHLLAPSLFAVIWRGVSDPTRRDVIAPRLAFVQGALPASRSRGRALLGKGRRAGCFVSEHRTGRSASSSDGAASRFGMPPRVIPHRRSRRPRGRFPRWAFFLGRGLIVRMRTE